MAIDTAKLLSEVSQSMTKIQTTLESKILNGFIDANPTNIISKAIKNLKNNVKISSGIIGSSTKNVPDDVFTAFATMICNDLAGSKIKKFETNDVKRTSQIANALKSGIKNEETTISINGTDYTIDYNIIAYAGVGTSWAHVRYKDKNKKNQYIILTWTNVGTKQGNQAIAEYGSLLKDLDLELWKSFFKKVLIVGTSTSEWRVANYGAQIVKSINNKNYAKSFLKGLGVEFKSINFGQFIKDNISGGDDIVSAAKLLKTLEKKQTALVNAIDKNKKIESKLKDFAKTCNKLETKLGLEKSDFSIGDFTSDPLNISNSKNYTLISGTTGNDTISNYGEHVTINSGAGNDSIYNSNKFIEIYTGKGNDYVYSDYTESVSIYGGEGDDTIDNYAGYGVDGNLTTIIGGSGKDSIRNFGGDSVITDGGTGNDNIYDYGHHNTIYGGKGKDYIFLDESECSIIFGGDDNDTIISGRGDITYDTNNATISGGKGNDIISLSSDNFNDIIKYAKGDGKDMIYGFNSDDTLQITKGSYKVSTKNNDVIVKVGSGSITLKDAKGRQISIQDSKGKVTTKTYGSSSANVAELFAENNFATADNLSEIVKNNLSATDYKIESQNFENLTQRNNLITFADK